MCWKQVRFGVVFLISSLLLIDCLRPEYSTGVGTCDEEWQRKGCYDEAVMDKGPRDSNMLVNWRHDIKWKKDEFPKFITKLACTCADEAIKANVSAFGLFWWGQCFPITLDDLEALDELRDVSDNCFKADGSYAKCEKKSDVNCIGNDEAVYIYSMEPIDGKFGPWSTWSSCSSSCGVGVQTRARECNNPPPSLGGEECTGIKNETTSCFLKHCPVNGGFSPWSNWGPCTRDCDGGLRERLRFCDNPSPTHGGAPCAGKSIEQESCNTDACSMDVYFSEWTTWSACSHTCGRGLRTRVQMCTHAHKCGDRTHEEEKECNVMTCPVDGGWNSWSTWTKCSKTCGKGTKARSRACNTPKPSNGGKKCEGEREEVEGCNTGVCGYTYNIREYDWAQWGAWGECNRRCGNGRQRAERGCLKRSEAAMLYDDEVRFAINKRWIDFNRWFQKAKKKIKHIGKVIKKKVNGAATHVKKKLSEAGSHIKKKLSAFKQHMKKKMKQLLAKGVEVFRYAGRLVFRWRKKCPGKSTRTRACNNHCTYSLGNCKLSNFAQYFYQGIETSRGYTHPKVVERLGKQYDVSFRFKANTISTGVIIQLKSKTGNNTEIGHRIPLVRLFRNSDRIGSLQIQLPVGEDFDRAIWFTKMIKPKTEYFVKITQKREGQKYFTTLLVSGGGTRKSVKMLNKNPKFFRDIHVHATPGWRKEADARITNLVIRGVCTK